jgi:hypothetical protein
MFKLGPGASQTRILNHDVVEILSDKKPSDTQRSRSTQTFYFTLPVPDELVFKILGPQQ